MSDRPAFPAELADEYVLGLLDPAAMAELEARLASDPALAAAVAAAQERFLPLDLTAADAGADAALWSRIEGAIGVQKPPAEVIPFRPRPAPEPRTGGGWRIAAIASMAAAALLAVGLGWQVSRDAPPAVVAVLLDAQGEPVVMVEAFADDTAHVTMLGDIELPPGRAMQLWTKPDPAGPPVSVGLLTEARNRILRGPDLPAPQATQLYEITFEAETGSPTGLPTGPILGKGFAKPPR